MSFATFMSNSSRTAAMVATMTSSDPQSQKSVLGADEGVPGERCDRCRDVTARNARAH